MDQLGAYVNLDPNLSCRSDYFTPHFFPPTFSRVMSEQRKQYGIYPFVTDAPECLRVNRSRCKYTNIMS